VENAYVSWNGAGPISDTKIFDTTSRQELDMWDRRFEPIRRLFPPRTTEANLRVARVATTSAKSASKDVVKLFMSGSWSWDLTHWFESAEFTQAGDNPDQLESDTEIELPDNGWRCVGKVMLFRDLGPERRPAARIVFENDVGERISAFWCWTQETQDSAPTGSL